MQKWTGHRQGGLWRKGRGRVREIWELSPRLNGDSFFFGASHVGPSLWAVLSLSLESAMETGDLAPISQQAGQDACTPLPQEPSSASQADYPPPSSLLPTCLLGLAPGGGAPRPVPCSVESCHADHVGGVAGQVLELHAVLSQEKCLHPFREVPLLFLPEINLWAQTVWQ